MHNSIPTLQLLPIGSPIEVSLPTLTLLLETTRSLRRDLETLIQEYPEDPLPPDDRIWPRLLSHDWRYLALDPRSPVHPGYKPAVQWMDAYWSYIGLLRDFCTYTLESPERFRLLPLNGNQRASAQRMLELLSKQELVLAHKTSAPQKRSPRRQGSDFEERVPDENSLQARQITSPRVDSPRTKDSDELLTARELEKMLSIDVKTIYAYAKRDLLPYVRIGSNLRFRKSEILRWIADKETRPRGRRTR
jgi:predicted DNA-binding transcriptional regulator AlpA